ncbi:MAG: four helix bundle protein [Bacteroidia bacterium]|nr:four helix bundle protein [Bacteroidia bacterium]
MKGRKWEDEIFLTFIHFRFLPLPNESEAEAAETQNWLDFAFECNYILEDTHHSLDKECDIIIGMLVNMQRHPDKWGI